MESMAYYLNIWLSTVRLLFSFATVVQCSSGKKNTEKNGFSGDDKESVRKEFYSNYQGGTFKIVLLKFFSKFSWIPDVSQFPLSSLNSWNMGISLTPKEKISMLMVSNSGRYFTSDEMIPSRPSKGYLSCSRALIKSEAEITTSLEGNTEFKYRAMFGCHLFQLFPVSGDKTLIL